MKLEITKKAAKSLDKIPDRYARLIVQHLQQLSKNPYPKQSKKLIGKSDYRIRVGIYRILYSVNKKQSIIISRIMHRKEVYR